MLQGADAERASAFIDLAHRLGALLPQLFDDALRQEIAVVLQGELDGIDAEPFIAALLAGALPLVTDRRVTLVNAGAIAREVGVRIAVLREADASPFRSALLVAAGDHRLLGTVLPHGPRIVEIDGFEIDAVAEGTMLLTYHRDVPGMVGRIGTILGEANVNISTMQVARNARGGDAMMVLEVDRDVERAVTERIGKIEGISAVRVVRV
jgi:D-3-phosphoglycerate dehydrogenase